jgi:hypothetical protein
MSGDVRVSGKMGGGVEMLRCARGKSGSWSREEDHVYA